MTKYPLRVLVLLAGCMLSLVGCAPSTPAPQWAQTAETTQTIEPTTKPTEPPKPIQITIAASGDILSHAPVTRSAAGYAASSGGTYDYSPMFSQIRDLLNSVDLSICHLETPISRDNTNLGIPGTLVFNSPRELADGIKSAGYDGCDFASNHTWDRGLDGVAATEEVLRAVGVGYAGPSSHEDRVNKAEIYKIGDVKVAHLAFTYTYPNTWGPDTTVPAEAPWLENWLWPAIGPDGLLEQAQKAKDEGADFVIVSMHWGQEYEVAPTKDQTTIAHKLLESDAVDLILGTHVHVVQPCELINGKHVIYGMGNLLSNQSPSTDPSLTPSTQDGMVALFKLTKDPDGKVTTAMQYQPTFVDLNGHVITPVTQASNADSYQRTVDAVNFLGGCEASVRGS